MIPKRFLPVLGVCLLAGSAACADQLGFVDCASHTDATPVFAKARKSQDIVANLPCGERFKVIVYGFVFSEIQTSDGKIGFVYSNVITVDAAGGTLQSRPAANTAPSLTAASEKTKIYAPKQTDAAPAQVPAMVPAPETVAMSNAPSAPTASATAAGSATDTTAATTPATAQPNAPAPQAISNSATPSAPASAIAPSAPAPAPPTLPGPDTVLKATATSATSADAPVDPNVPTPAPSTASASANAPSASTPSPAAPASQPAPADAPASAAPNSANSASPNAPATPAAPDTTSSTAPAAPIAQPDPAPAAPPQPAADAQPQPAAPSSAEVEPGITPAKSPKQRWEKPNPGARSASLLELFGGFSFASMSNGTGYANNTNFMGGMGSFGLNIKPWLQVVGDTSYSFENSTGVKNVIYGNHYGPRFFLRGRTKWAISPFGEVLVGGSRADTTVAASGGNPAYTTSQNCFSIKAGGGLDLKPSRMFEIRLIDVDYYRTAFGTNVHQSNYWVSTGVVIRLMKPWWE